MQFIQRKAMRSFMQDYWGLIAIVVFGAAGIVYAQTDYAQGLNRPGLSPWIGSQGNSTADLQFKPGVSQ